MKKLFCMLLLLCGCSVNVPATEEKRPDFIELECGRKVVSFAAAHGEHKVLTRPMQDSDKPETLFVDYYVSTLQNKMTHSSRILVVENKCR
jgi:hypothetical protein